MGRQWEIYGPDQDILTKADIIAYLRLGSERALDRLIASGQFPRGRRLGTTKASRVIWTGADLAAWQQLEGRFGVGEITPESEGEEDS